MNAPKTPDDWITIGSDQLIAAINPQGAELSSLTDSQGRELMTDADPAFWGWRAPILFPIVGAVNGNVIRVDGRDYPMKKHGFARHSRLMIAAQDAASVTLRLTDDAETRAAYPFAFVLEVTFAVETATLSVTARIGNPGEADLPASFGFHPAFAWPLPFGKARGGHAITFDRVEPGPLRGLDAAGLITDRPRPSPLADGRTLALADDLFADDALIWDPVDSDGVRYGADGAPTLHVAFPNTPKLGIWTKPGSAFVCIEPWHGIADPVDYTGEFRDKPGVFLVPPGAEQAIEMRVTLEG